LANSEFASLSVMLSNNDNGLSSDKRIVVGTCHATKGFEFRSNHLLAAELLTKFENNRKMTFTTVTRTKTTLAVYHGEGIHGYLDSAIKSTKADPDEPTFDEIFGGQK
jgi:superfamily I DNA and RNA helicase